MTFKHTQGHYNCCCFRYSSLLSRGSRINGDRLCLWPIAKKFVTGDYISNSYPETKFGENPPMRGLLGKCVKYSYFLFIYRPTLFWGNSPTGHTGRRIFKLDGSNDANSHKDVPFLSFFILLSI